MSSADRLLGFEEVKAAEVEVIEKQRAKRNDDKDPNLLMGLAISGGGIRSATFALGVLQTFKELKLLKSIDYLSTVSGGGYIGAWLVANRNQEAKAENKAKAAASRSSSLNDAFLEDASEQMHHLRRFSRYLTPRTYFVSADSWTAAVIWLRNTASMQLLLGLFLCCMLLLPRVMSCGFAALAAFSVTRSREFLCSQVIAVVWVAYSSWVHLRSLVNIPSAKQTPPSSRRRRVVARWISKVVSSIGNWVSKWHSKLASLIRRLSPKWLVKLASPLPYECLPIVGAVLGSWIIAPALWMLAHQTKEKGLENLNMWQTFWVGVAIAVAVFLMRLQYVARNLVKHPGNRNQSHGKLLQNIQIFAHLTVQVLLIIVCTLVLCKTVLTVFQMIPHPHPQPSAGGERIINGGELLQAVFGNSLPASSKLTIHDEGLQLASAVGMPMILLSYATLIGFGIAISGADIPSRVREWWARIAAWLTILSASWCALGLFCFKGPWVVKSLVDAASGFLNWKSVSAVLTWIFTTMAGLAAGKSEKTDSATGRNRAMEVVATVAPYVFAFGLLLLVSFFMENLVPFVQERLSINCAASGAAAWATLGVVLALLLVLAWMFDINELSMNQFYRNRLMRCYLGGARPKERRPDPFTGFDFDDDVALRDLAAGKSFKGPFWIINTALNTTKAPDLDVAERQAESFVFTPLHCGFFRENFGLESRMLNKDAAPQGYRELANYGFKSGTSKHLSGRGVTTAFAITASGAAASPNSGYHTSPVTAFLMTVFNVRLGWWLPNPVRESWKDRQPRAMSRFALKELFGLASASDNCVYISDGGHFENLGLYELIRRKCKLIIVSDGEQDEDYRFHALGTAIRRCWVDFRARIEIDVSNIKPKTPGGTCGGRCAIGKIFYDIPADTKAQNEPVRKPDAWLVYLKLSWTGDEETDLQQYKAYNPSFPHHSTANQWFTESQFESYRKLGCHVAKTALSPTLAYLGRIGAGLESLGPELSSYWAPAAAKGASPFIKNTQTLIQIWKDVASDSHLRFLDPLVVPGLPGLPGLLGIPTQTGGSIQKINPPDKHSEAGRTGSYLCQRLFQLMENVYLDLDLAQQHAHPDQSGWMALFKHWVSFQYFRDEWEVSKETYGKRLQAFWTQALLEK